MLALLVVKPNVWSPELLRRNVGHVDAAERRRLPTEAQVHPLLQGSKGAGLTKLFN